MARGSSLSDERIIEKLNREFVVIDGNITEYGFPRNVPALNPWRRKFAADLPRFTKAFTTSVIVSSDGKTCLGASGGTGSFHYWKETVCYNPDRFSKFLDNALDRDRRMHEINADPVLTTKEKAAALARIRTEIWLDINKACIHHMEDGR